MSNICYSVLCKLSTDYWGLINNDSLIAKNIVNMIKSSDSFVEIKNNSELKTDFISHLYKNFPKAEVDKVLTRLGVISGESQ